jgi:NodT family efflux transporter outer membrane factor (OMF) lipoprotein
MRRTAAALASALLTAACVHAPSSRPPQQAVPDAYAEPSRPTADADLQTWWRGFDDAVLSSLVDRALAQNLDLQAAASRVREARAGETIAGARALPQVQANASASRNHISKNAIPAPPGTGGGGLFGIPGSSFDQFKLGFDASWEIDLFGAARHGVDAARARTQAQEWSARDLRVSLAAEVARTYFELRSLQARVGVAHDELRRPRETLELIRSRVQAGFVTHLDLDQQAALTEQASAAIPPLEAQVRQQIHALGVLVGQPPEALIAELAPPARIPGRRPVPPPGLPSELLRRRPDIRAAERKAASAVADVGVATADLYPRISLTASPSLVSTDLSNLLDWSSRNYSFGAGLIWPLFEGGRLKAQLAQADERQQRAVLDYRKTVLGALKDVEDALARLDADRQRRAELEAAVGQANGARAIALDQYRAGTANYTGVLTAEQGLHQAEDQLAQTRAAGAEDAVALYKALGGGWSETDLQETRR